MKVNISKFLPVLFFFISVQNIFAQPDFGDDVEDAAPIDNWVYPVLIIGLAIAFLYLKKANQFKLEQNK